MADYIPPTEDLPIFDSSVFLTGDSYITQNQADKRYLRYPNAQGTENLQAINVNGNAQFNSTSNFKQDLTIESTADIIQQSGSGIFQQPASLSVSGTNVLNPISCYTSSGAGVTPQLIVGESTGNKNFTFIANTNNDAYNKIVNAGDCGIFGNTAPLVLTNSTGGNPTNGLRLDNTSITLGTGGSSDVPTNAIILNSSGATSFNSTTPPTSSQTIPAFTDSSNKIPTTAWVQGAIQTASTAEYSYTTAGTYSLTKPANYGHLKIICIGAGGGGGGGADMGNPSGGDKGATGGAGGGGGGVTIVDMELTTETTFNIVVGAGGTGGTAGGYPNNAGNGGNGGTSYVISNSSGLYYAYSTGGSGGTGGFNQVAANSLTQPSGGAGGSGSQGVGGQGGKGVGLNNPSGYNTGFVFSGTVGSQSALIGAGGGGGGGAVYETPGSGGGNIYIDSDGQNGGALGFTLSQSILQGFGVGGKASGGAPAWQQPTSGSSVIRGVGGGGGGGGFASAFSGSSPPAAGGAAGGAGSGGGGGGSDHTYGSTGGRGGDGVVIMFFS